MALLAPLRSFRTSRLLHQANQHIEQGNLDTAEGILVLAFARSTPKQRVETETLLKRLYEASEPLLVLRRCGPASYSVEVPPPDATRAGIYHTAQAFSQQEGRVVLVETRASALYFYPDGTSQWGPAPPHSIRHPRQVPIMQESHPQQEAFV